MTTLSASRCAQPAGMPSAPRRRWPQQAAVASALLLAAASPAAASDIGSFLGAVGGMLSQGMQPHYYQYQQPQYYYQPAPQYYQSPGYHHHYTGSSAAARRKAQAEAEAKRKQEEAEKQKKKEEEAAAAAVPATTEPSGAVDVAMTRKSGNLWVPAKINNVVTIDFVIDSGASDITLPRDVYLTLIRSGTLTKANYIGGANFGIADGSEVKGLKFKLASLQVGNQVLTDVVASVMPSDSATPLLGLSFLSRFQSWSVDNKSGTLKLLPIGAKPAAQTATAAVQPLPEPPDAGQPAAGAAPQMTPLPPAAAASPATVVPAVAAEPKLAAAMPRSGHVATAAFVVKEAGAPAAPTAAATAPMIHASVPVFPANTSYANARSSLLALGYGPAPLPAAGKCDSTTDATCFPERASCARSDAVHCDYLWRRGDELIKVETVAVPPTVKAVECQVNCKQQ